MDQTEVRQLVARELEVPLRQVRLDSDLLSDLGGDSLAFAQMSVALEARLQCQISHEDLMDIRTVGDLWQLTERLQSQASSSS